MSRCLSASQIKKARGSKVELRPMPREGTKLRRAYDLFQANKGIPVEFPRTMLGVAQINNLQDFYGLDIRIAQRAYEKDGYGNNRPPLSMLAGEWFGRVYIDYVAERIEAVQ
jgi:hypothetical protein